MVKLHHISFNVVDRSYLALIKKDIHALAQLQPFTPQRLAEIDIIVAELSSNLIKYGQEGQLLVKILAGKDGSRAGVEIISIDNGPGIADVSRMMQDGISTGNTAGNGLGAIKRLSDVFEIYTVKGWGTIILSRIWCNAPAGYTRPPAGPATGVVIVPKPGETDCGDVAGQKQNAGQTILFLGDVLGHGTEASQIGAMAMEAFDACTEESPVEILRYIHQAIRKTRGMVATVAVFNTREKIWKVCGVGNITCKIGTWDQGRNYMPYNGIVGMNIPNSMNEQQIPYVPGQLITLCSDGLKTRLEWYKIPGIYKQDASILAAAFYKDYGRQTDDMSVLVGKLKG